MLLCGQKVFLIITENKKMFGIFSGKKERFIGVDFGTSSIKIVELSYFNQKPHLENYGWINLDAALHVEDKKELKLQSHDDGMRGCFKELCSKMNLVDRKVYVSLPGFSGLITLIEFPQMETEELENAIQFEAHKYIPSSIEEIAMSWEIVGREKTNILPGDTGKHDKGGKMQVLLVAAPRKEIVRYEHMVTAADLEVGAIELETFSIARSLVGDDLGNSLIIDIGSRTTNIILIEKGIIKVNRNIDVGGSEITKTIAESMNISEKRAEALKCGDKDIINSKESSIVVPMLELISGEALRIINAYKQRNNNIRIDSVILSGGTAHMKGISEYFSKSLSMQASVGNPWRRVMCEEIVQSHVTKLGASFSVALGLALRGIEEYQRR